LWRLIDVMMALDTWTTLHKMLGGRTDEGATTRKSGEAEIGQTVCGPEVETC
jgi:hypothetical protein